MISKIFKLNISSNYVIWLIVKYRDGFKIIIIQVIVDWI
jgi:hypothetical protein